MDHDWAVVGMAALAGTAGKGRAALDSKAAADKAASAGTADKAPGSKVVVDKAALAEMADRDRAAPGSMAAAGKAVAADTAVWAAPVDRAEVVREDMEEWEGMALRGMGGMDLVFWEDRGGPTSSRAAGAGTHRRPYDDIHICRFCPWAAGTHTMGRSTWNIR
jgi:hypothetical protein